MYGDEGLAQSFSPTLACWQTNTHPAAAVDAVQYVKIKFQGSMVPP